MKVGDPAETYFLLSYLEFTEDLNFIQNQNPFCCPLRLDCWQKKPQKDQKKPLKNLAKNIEVGNNR